MWADRAKGLSAGLLFSKVVKALALFKLLLQAVLSGRTGEASSISVLDETRCPFWDASPLPKSLVDLRVCAVIRPARSEHASSPRGAQRRLLPKGGCDLPVYLFDIAGLQTVRKA